MLRNSEFSGDWRDGDRWGDWRSVARSVDVRDEPGNSVAVRVGDGRNTALYHAMRKQGVGRAKLARRLRWHLPQVTRVLDLRHASRAELMEAAFAALGLRLTVDVARAA
jgi:antitoxin HicB